MRLRPYFQCHGHQSFIKASASSSIRQLYFFPLDNLSGRIECKLGPFVSCFMSISQSEELRQVRQFVNSSILKVDEIDEKNIIIKTLFLSFR